ncbi:hypothetical protein LEP1GSC050_0543 [Leptospira broomii serovar Hurstbridge str. 5399]|uniref:Uncharacterized protein n=1 Tax=Leptospira broomii serovar Hurstbridge str. 5399 TaxID=1049789 RepID=T0F773_9LEPT|nr:hypothetical protein LEP1GSC050_0543 [Leptospira broomii serovar Hurstbridge str. 5399]
MGPIFGLLSRGHYAPSQWRKFLFHFRITHVCSLKDQIDFSEKRN